MQMKGTMGLIGCNSLADEIAYLLHRDCEISRIFIISNPEGSYFHEVKLMKPLADRACLIQEKDLGLLEHASAFTVVLWLIPSSLHEAPSLLFPTLADTATRMGNCVDSIFVAHGLCGVSQHKLTKMMKTQVVPINFLTYPNGEIADDCFGSFVGSKKGYLEFIKKNKFAMFLTTGFAEYLRSKYENQDIVSLVREIEELRFTLEKLGFNKVIKLEANVGNADEFDWNVSIISRTLGLKIESVKCDLSVFDHSYDLGKRRINRSDPHEAKGTLDSVSTFDDHNEEPKRWTGFGDEMP